MLMVPSATQGRRTRAVGPLTLRVAAVVAAAASVAGCHEAADPDSPADPTSQGSGRQAGGQLSFPDGKLAAFGFGKDNTPAGQTVTMNTTTLCTAGGGPAQIVSITLKDSENLSLVDWGVRPYPPDRPDVGTWNGKVLENPTFTQDPVKSECQDKEYTELDISARRAGGVGIAHGFDVKTTEGTLFVPMRIALCPAACPRESLQDLP
jgi:hypothetical protein